MGHFLYHRAAKTWWEIFHTGVLQRVALLVTIKANLLLFNDN